MRRDKAARRQGFSPGMFVVMMIVGVAIYHELSKPREEREWHGTVPVPYEFRLPTAERIRRAYWNPDDPRILTETAFGVGWAINLPSLIRLSRRLAKHLRGYACCVLESSGHS